MRVPANASEMGKDVENIITEPSVKEQFTNDQISDVSMPEENTFISRGVQRMEWVKASMDNSKSGKRLRIYFFVILFIIAYVYTLDEYSTSNYSPTATSAFSSHSLLSTISIANSIVSAVTKIWIAKIADITSRPWTYGIVLVFYTVGTIMEAASPNITTYAAGSVFTSVGATGIVLLNTIMSADITPLKYRGLALSMLATPYIVNAWITGYIVEDILESNWRWGYGMFCIIMPVVIGPALIAMSWLEHKAKKTQAAQGQVTESPKQSTSGILHLLWKSSLECDMFGLLLLGFGWALLLLPFSLRTTAQDGWRNPSLIAMFIVGGLLLVLYTLYEFYIAPYPSMPKRVLFNRAFIMACVIDFFYQMGSALRLIYLSSYALVCFDWSYKNWTYFNNCMTVCFCFFGVIAGLLQRVTHRAKYLQIFGISMQVISCGITFWARYDNLSTVAIVWTQILAGIGVFSQLGSRVLSQASVAHQDMALVISLWSQWSYIGNAIGAAIAGAIWQAKLPQALRARIPSSVPDEEVTMLFESVIAIYQLPFESEARQGARLAYFDVTYYLFAIAIGVTCISFVFSLFQKNYYLGDDQNAMESNEETCDSPPKNAFQKLLRFLDEPLEYRNHSKRPAKVNEDQK